MTKQDIQKQIIDAVLDAEIYDQLIVADVTFKPFADEHITVQVGIELTEIEEWIELSGLLLNEVDRYNSDFGHYTVQEITPIEDFDIDNEVIREYIRTNDTFTII